jgi:hypothetical protein
MPYALDRAASRFGRDRDVFPDRPRHGPYEAPYDVRRGYQEPLRASHSLDRDEPQTLHFLGRETGLTEEGES